MNVGAAVATGFKRKLNGLPGFKSKMAFWSGNLNFTTNQLLDKSGNNNHLSLVDSYCLSFNGTTAYVQFNGAYIANISAIEITACPNGGAWTVYTNATAPTGLYSIAAGVLYIGKSGSNFFNGKVARVVCKDSNGATLKDFPFSHGYGTSIYEIAVTVDTTPLVANFENGALLDTNANGLPDPFGNGATNFTTTTASMVDAAINGWTGRHCRIDITTKGAGTFWFAQASVTPGTLFKGGYWKVRYRTNILHTGLEANGPYLKFAQWPGGINGGFLCDGIETIKEKEFYVPGSNCTQITLYLQGTVANGNYFEFDLIQLRKYSSGGTIVNATWDASCPVYHNNLKNGFAKCTDGINNIYLPHTNGVLPTSFNDPTFYLFKSFSGRVKNLVQCETKLQFPNVASLKLIDTKNYLYDVGGNANKLSFYDIVGAKGDYFFSNVYNSESGIYDIILLKNALTAFNLNKLNNELIKNDKRIYVNFGANIYIVSPYSSGKYLSRMLTSAGDLSYDSILTEKEYSSRVGLIPKQSGDDLCPVNLNNSYVGAHHGYVCLSDITLAGHNKTVSDIGSNWTKGGMSYKLVDLNSTHLFFIQNGSYNNSGVLQKWILTSGTLVHSSGAVNTGDIVFTTVVGSQLYASRTSTASMYADDVLVNSGFSGYCKKFEVRIVENIYDYLVIENFYPNNMANCPIAVRREISYFYYGNNSTQVVEKISVLRDNINALTGYVGVDQAIPMNIALTGVTKHYFYFPGSKNFTIGSNNYDFRTPTNLFAGLADSMNFNASQRETGKNVNRMVQALANNANLLYGFSHGYLTQRDDLLNTGNQWYFYTTKKSYPEYISGIVLPNGFSKTISAFRKIFDPVRTDDATYSYVVKTSTGYRLYIDLHKNVSQVWIQVPPEIVGRMITTVECHANMTVHSSQVLSDGVQVSCINAYGYAVLDLD